MTGYGTLLRDHVTLRCGSIRPHLSPGVCTQASGRGGRMHVSSLAAEIPNSFLSRLWQNRRCVCEGRLLLCRSESYSRGPLQEGREERGDGAALSGSGGAGGPGPGGADRCGAGEGIHLEIVASEGAGEGPPSPHGFSLVVTGCAFFRALIP